MNKPLCLRCQKNPAIIHPRFGVVDCEVCKSGDVKIREHAQFSTLSQQDRITSQRDHQLGLIAQPWDESGKPNEVFVKANTREDVLEYFTPEQLSEAGF